MTEFNLSDERVNWNESHHINYYLEKDVKEFIKLLKEEVSSGLRIIDGETVPKIIDKLAGEKLK